MKKDQYKKKHQLIDELSELRQRLADLESLEVKDYLDKIINSISDPISVKDSKHRLVLVNDAECDLAGRSREELIGKTDYDFFPKEQVDIFWQKDDEVLKTGKENINEEEITDAQGRKRTIVTKKTFYIDKAGNRFIVGIIRDITERKQSEKALQEAHDKLEMRVKQRTAELEAMNKQLQIEIAERKKTGDALRKSEERFRALTESTSDWIWEVDQNSFYTYASPKIKDLLGYEPEEIIGKTPFDFMPPDEAERLIKIFTPILNYRRPFVALENKNLHKNGTIVVLETSGVPILDADGNLLGYRGIDRDITRRKHTEERIKESEERYRTLFENAHDMIQSISPDGHFIFVNPAWLRTMGYAWDELQKLTIFDILRPSYIPHCTTLFQKVMSGESPDNVETIFISKDGKQINVEGNLSARFINGKAVAYYGIFRDITEHKKLEAQLLQAQKMEAIGQLAGGIAHDFNNLLTAIIGYGNLLKTEVIRDNRLSSYITQILSAADRAAHLTNDLLTFSRKQIVNPKPVNLNEIVQEVENLLSRIIGEDIELSTVLTNNDVIIMADRTQIEQVLMNLATNARDAMPDGGSLLIRTELTELDNEFIKAHGYGRIGSYVLLTFEDTGTGMDERTKERIFEPFFTTKEVGKGTGLGLAMVYGIVKQHDGYINIYSEPGGGTTFKMYFPLIQPKGEETQPAASLSVKRGTETILIGEDDIQVRQLMKEVLLNVGYEMIETVDGEDALRLFHENKDKIQLLILDVIMPKKSGKEVYEEIKKVSPDIKVIFISGYSIDLMHKKGILEEGLNFIPKPVSPEALLTKVREVLNR